MDGDTKTKRIAVLSCADTGNFGDDIIFEGVRTWASKHYDTTPDNVRHFLKIKSRNIDIINDYDVLVVGGGEILSKSDTLEQLIESDVKIPYVFMGVGIGSVDDIIPYKDKLSPEIFGVRTRKDMSILRDLDIDGYVSDDMLFYCDIKFKPSGGNGRIGLNIKNQNKSEDFISEMAERLDALIGRGVLIDLLAFNCKPRQEIDYCGEMVYISDCSDLELLDNIRLRMKRDIEIIEYRENPMHFLNELSAYKGIVGERLHSAIAACFWHVPFKIVSYHDKINKFLSELRNKIIGSDPACIEDAIKDLWR